jgi:hypothetical protein
VWIGANEGLVGGMEVLLWKMTVGGQLLRRCALMLVAVGHASEMDVG